MGTNAWRPSSCPIIHKIPFGNVASMDIYIYISNDGVARSLKNGLRCDKKRRARRVVFTACCASQLYPLYTRENRCLDAKFSSCADDNKISLPVCLLGIQCYTRRRGLKGRWSLTESSIWDELYRRAPHPADAVPNRPTGMYNIHEKTIYILCFNPSEFWNVYYANSETIVLNFPRASI